MRSVNEPIVVKQNLNGNLLYIVGAIFLSLLSLLFVFLDFRTIPCILKVITQTTLGYYFVKIFFAFGFLFFGYAFFYLLKRAKFGKDILIVDDKGITDNSSALAFGFIPWRDIENIYIDRFFCNQFIEIVLKNEEQYLKKLRGLKKLAVLVNKKKHSAVCITLNTTGISPKELLPKILEMFKQSKLN